MVQSTSSWTQRLPGILAPICISGSVAWYLGWEIVHRGIYQYATTIYQIDDADEWRYVACSRLVAHGYALFTQVFSAQPPLLFLGLAGSMRIFGDSISGARIGEISLGLVSLVSVASLAWLMEGALASAVAALLLAVSPLFLIYSHTVEAEGPMAALVTLSLVVVIACVRTKARPFAVSAGLVLAGAVLVKLFAIEGALPAIWLLMSQPKELRSRLLDGTLFGVATAVPVALDFLLVSPRSQWDQVVKLHEQASQLHLPGNPAPLQLLKNFLQVDAGLTVLALAGLIALAITARWRWLIFLLLWTAGQVLMLLLFRPVFPHHLAIMLPSFATTAGVGLGVGISGMQRKQLVPGVVVVLAVLVYLFLAPRLVHDARHVLILGSGQNVSVLATFVASRTQPTSFVAADDLAVADGAGRLVPPPLCDPSIVRLKSGYLTGTTLIRATSRFHVALVVPSFGIYEQVPEYMRWLEHHYRERNGPGGLAVFSP